MVVAILHVDEVRRQRAGHCGIEADIRWPRYNSALSSTLITSIADQGVNAACVPMNDKNAVSWGYEDMIQMGLMNGG